MCMKDDNDVRLMRCPHGAFHLRVGNSTLHLTGEQLLAIYQQISRCFQHTKVDITQAEPSAIWLSRYGQSSN